MAAAVRARYGWHIPPAQATRPRHPRATGIFSYDARRIVAEDVIIVAERLSHRALTTGHVLVALLERAHTLAAIPERAPDLTSEIIRSLPGVHETTAAVIEALPGEEDT